MFAKLPLVIASTVILGSESCGTHGHTLLSHDTGSHAIDGKLLLVLASTVIFDTES
jgi:hypothetical protein